jgi:hypothetical protein
MGQKLAAVDSSGNITAFYDTTDSPAPSGSTTIELTDAQWQACISTPGYTVKNGALMAPTPLTAAQQLASAQVNLCASIDSTADAAYIQIGGPSPGRLAEYQQANTDAQTFKAAGYTGTVPQTVQCWATAANLTSQQAADSILATASQWESVLVGIRSARLIGKANVNAATTVGTAQSAAATAIANVKAAAGIS